MFLEHRQYCFEIEIGYLRLVPRLNRQGSDGAFWMNNIMTCTQAGGMLVYVLVFSCAQV